MIVSFFGHSVQDALERDTGTVLKVVVVVMMMMMMMKMMIMGQ
jgi:hypothetical protein